MIDEHGVKIRLDKWLWQARFFKTRSLASTVCRSGKIRLNGQHTSKASVMVQPGDVLTFPKEAVILVVKILACGARRGPAIEAQTLYEDLTPPENKPGGNKLAHDVLLRDKGAGRPTKAERRALDKLMGRDN
ncbi:RNA-binding S4 domain-containing protein [Kordiimonas pumila]|uniref:RNA-binding S4 domain-containing protein n=1 Tax=Kordiimonas pumila TaxID=2161677 RepID=A0ABV7D340_9PROT|nr:RNA-binding S4 domain-containing protein [Kordiimonas pumila]